MDIRTTAESTFRVEAVAFDDPRAESMRGLLDDELDARYRVRDADDPPELAAARTIALTIHPEQIAATFIAVEAGVAVEDGVAVKDAEAGEAVGHAMLRRLDSEWELKRLIVADTARGRGVGRALVTAVVEAARVGGAERVILQTGEPQYESLGLYRSMGFTPIAVYEPYVETMPRSLCFELHL